MALMKHLTRLADALSTFRLTPKQKAARRRGAVVESAEGVRFAYTQTQTRPPTEKV